MRSLSVLLLLCLLVPVLAPSALAHDVTLTGTSSFTSLDGSSSDHDGVVNGVFTVSDGNLVVSGQVLCTDAQSPNNNGCNMAFAVSGDMTVNAGASLQSDNLQGSGNGGNITLTVGGNLTLGGATTGPLAPGAIVSTGSVSSSGGDAGSVTANVGGSVDLGLLSVISAASRGRSSGAITIVAGGPVAVNGVVASAAGKIPLVLTMWTGRIFQDGVSQQRGGAITIRSTGFAEPAVTVGHTGLIASQGRLSSGTVLVEGCGVIVRGLVGSVSDSGASKVSIRSGKGLTIESQDLGVSTFTPTRLARIRADSLGGDAVANKVDLFANEAIQISGVTSSLQLHTISSNPGDGSATGGRVTVISLSSTVTAGGRAIQAGLDEDRNKGGRADISAKGNVNLDTASIRAIGDYSERKNGHKGGQINVRSHSGNISWVGGIGDARPTGSSVSAANRGTITLTACGTVTTSGSSFPTNGPPVGPYPTIASSCSPAAPSLPAGEPVMTVCNTPPVANDTAASTNEDTTVTVNLSGSDADGDSLTFTIVSGPSNGSLGSVISTGPTTATVNYTPNLHYNGGDSFVYQANDGNGGTDDATATITIAPVNDPPSFLAGPTVSVLEDAGAQTYANWATAISSGPADESGQTVTFSVTSDNPSLFSVQPALASNGTLTFTPAANAYGTANLTVTAQDDGGTANGGDDTSNPQNSAINVTPVNDEPSFVAGANQSVNEDAGAQSVANWATSIDAGPNEGSQSVTFVVTNDNNALFSSQPAVSPAGTLTYTPAANANGAATVSVTLTDDGGTANGGDDTSATQNFTISVGAVNDAPSFTSGGNVSVNEDSGAYSAAWATAISAGPADEAGQTLTFNITGNTNAALFSVAPSIAAGGTLSFTLAADAFGTATITVTLSDNGGTANGGVDTSAPQSFDIIVGNVNDEPAFTPGGDVSVDEDSGAYSATWATAISAGPNESGQTLTFNVSNDNNALFAAQPAISASGVLTFTPAADAFGTATVTVTLQDDGGIANGGDDTSATVTFEIVVESVNDAPSFVSGGDVTVDEDSGAYSAPWATSVSAGPANESGQTLTFTITGNTNAALFASGPSIAPDGTLTFTPVANAFGSASITVILQDNGGTANGGVDTSAAVNFNINVTSVNDPPTFTAGGDVTVNEDSGVYLAAWATAISAGPGESQPLTFTVLNDNNALFSAQPSISPAGVLSFTPAPNAFGAANVTVTLSDSIDSTAPVTFVITVNGINDPPTAGNDSWETEGNTELRVDVGAGATPHVFDTTTSGKGVADNDADTVEGDPFTVTAIVGCGDVVSPYVCAVTGGTVTMNANGSFSFQPAAGATSASFQYEVTDQPAAGIPATAIGTVTITIHDMIWYVNGSAAPGNGTSAAPFSTFAALNGLGDVDSFGDYIFVHTSAVSGSIALEGGQRLWGEGVGLIIPRNLNGNGSPAILVAPGVKPTVTQAAGDVVTVTGVAGVEIAGLSLAAPAGSGIDVTSLALGAAAGASIYSNTITAGSEGIDINANAALGTSATIDNTSIISTGNGVDLLASDGNVVFAYTNGSVLSVSGSGIVADGSAADILFVSGLSNVTIDGNTAGDGIAITNARFDANPGTAAFDTISGGAIAVGSSGNPVGVRGVVLTNASGDLAFGTLSAYAGTSGVAIAGTGLFSGAAGMRVTSGGGAINASAGAGLSVTNTTIGAANLAFTSISSAGAVNGILLNNTGIAGGLKVLGTGSAGSGGTIQNTSSHGVLLTSTFSPSFNNLSVLNTSGSGVKGTQVTDFTFTNGAIDNSGTGGGTNESNLAFNTASTFTENNLSGTVTITGNALTNALWHGLDVLNFNGTLANLVASNNVITSATTTALSKGSALRVQILGSASTVSHLTKGSLANNIISNFPSGSGIQVLGGNTNAAGSPGTVGISGSGADLIAITGNQIKGLSPAVRLGTSAIIAGVSGRGQANFDISGNGTVANPLTNIAGIGISVGANGFVNATVTTSNNVIVANNSFASAGIGGGTGVVFTNADTPNLTWTITGNSISNVDGNGILAVARSATGFLKLKIQNNIVAAPLTGVRQGIRVDAGNGASINDTVCLNISGNTSAGSGGATGVALRKQGTNAAINAFGIDGLPSSPAGSPVVENYVDSQNPAGGGTLLLSATSGFTACPNP